MKKSNISLMKKGWFVGNFEPSVMKTNDFEVGVKYYLKGEKEEAHVHRIASEITVVISGKVKMCGMLLGSGDIVVLDPGDKTSFEAIEDSVTVVVKSPSVLGDKYLI